LSIATAFQRLIFMPWSGKSFLLLSNRADSLVTSFPSKMRKCAEPPEYLRNEISFLRTCNIPNLMSCIYRIALSKCFTVCVSTSGVSNTNCSEGLIRTYKATEGPHYDADATMAVLEPYKKQLLHFISCEMYRELWAQIISSCLYVRLKKTCSLAGGALLNIGE